MTAQPPPPPEEDGSADTQMFRKFVEGEPAPAPRPVGAPFRIATLLVGLIVFAGLVYLLLKL